MPSKEAIIEALRCSSATGKDRPECKGYNCPYFYEVSKDDPERIEFEKENSVFPDVFWQSCDVDRMSRDAADMLEEM